MSITTMHERPATSRDFAAILALNEESVHFLSSLSSQRLAELDCAAELHRVLEVDGHVTLP